MTKVARLKVIKKMFIVNQHNSSVGELKLGRVSQVARIGFEDRVEETVSVTEKDLEVTDM